MADVKHSMNTAINAELRAYHRTRDLLPDRVVWADGKWTHKVLAFRAYLRVKNNKHRLALTHAVLSGHALAMERMGWSERDHLEDAIHAMFVCRHAPLVNIRDVFFEKLFTTHPELRGIHSDPGPFFKELLVKEKIIGLLGKLAYDIFEVFYLEPMLTQLKHLTGRPHIALRTGQRPLRLRPQPLEIPLAASKAACKCFGRLPKGGLSTIRSALIRIRRSRMVTYS
ncbi:hypothetical protein C8R47DRAFT_1223518 [Mycena vitilis]|nr:hypothetical protein C8R47DRAFT_1223518 [Mycena vitilis]